MNKNELIVQFGYECTELDRNGKTVVKGTPMDIINWIAEKFRLSDVMKPLPSDAEIEKAAREYWVENKFPKGDSGGEKEYIAGAKYMRALAEGNVS